MHGTRGINLASGLLSLALLAGCQSGSKDESVTMVEQSPAKKKLQVAEPVELLGTRDGDQGDLPHAGVWLIRSHGDMVKADSSTIGGLGVDLSAHDIVVVALGEQPTGGFGVQITAIQQVGDTLYVQGKATTPGPDATTTQAVTNPWAAAVIPNTTATKVHTDIE